MKFVYINTAKYLFQYEFIEIIFRVNITKNEFCEIA